MPPLPGVNLTGVIIAPGLLGGSSRGEAGFFGGGPNLRLSESAPPAGVLIPAVFIDADKVRFLVGYSCNPPVKTLVWGLKSNEAPPCEMPAESVNSPGGF